MNFCHCPFVLLFDSRTSFIRPVISFHQQASSIKQKDILAKVDFNQSFIAPSVLHCSQARHHVIHDFTTGVVNFMIKKVYR